MNRQEKEDFVQSLKQDFAENKGLFLVGYKGLKVAQVINLRKQLVARGGIFQVAKVTLIKRAVSDNDEVAQQLDPLLKDQVALVFSRDASSGVAKVLHDFAKKNDKLSIIAGRVDNTFLSAHDFAAFVTLPPREVLLAKLCGTLNAPTTTFVCMLRMIITKLVVALHQIEQQKAQSNG